MVRGLSNTGDQHCFWFVGPAGEVQTRRMPYVTSRRTAFKVGGAVTAAVSAPDLLLAKKIDGKHAVVGSGQFKYECEHDWAKLPAGKTFGNATQGMAIDSVGNIYVTHGGSPGSLFVFDAKGKFIKALAMNFMEKGVSVGHGIDIRKEGKQEFMYLSPAVRKATFGFAKMTLDGELVWHKDRSAIAKDSGLYEKKGARFRATNVNFLPDGGYCLGDGYGSGYLHLYDKDDRYVRSFGGGGATDGKFKTPHGQWLDDRDGVPKIAVCDRANSRLQWFTPDGKHLKTLGGFLFPADIDIQGEVMLIPDLHARITLLDKNNRVITHLGDDEEWRKQVLAKGKIRMRNARNKWKAGRFVHPHDAAFDKDGNIMVSEWVATGRVSKLRKLS